MLPPFNQKRTQIDGFNACKYSFSASNSTPFAAIIIKMFSDDPSDYALCKTVQCTTYDVPAHVNKMQCAHYNDVQFVFRDVCTKKNIIFVSTKLKMSQLHIRHVVLCSTLYAYELIFLFSYGIGKVSRRYFSFLAFSSVWFASSFRMFGVILLHKRNASSTRLCHVSVNSARHSFSLSLPLTTILS